MTLESYSRRPVCTVNPEETLRTAAQRMEKEGVGLLVVAGDDERMEGVLTDRDVALHVVARGHDGGVAHVREAMSAPAVSAEREGSLEDALARLARARVRRLPVVEGERAEGLVSADDLALLLAREIGGLGEVLVAQLPAGTSRAGGPEGSPPRAGRAAEHYAGDVVIAAADGAVSHLAHEMEERAVGSVVLLDGAGRAAGLVTDRDLALRVVAAGLEPVRTPASAVMSTPLVSASPSEPLEEVVARMRTASVRRIPILREARPVGIVTFDDLLVAFARELGQLADCVSGEIRRARRRSYSERVRHELEDRLEEAAARLRQVGDQALGTLGRELEQVLERVGVALRSARPGAWRARVAVADLMQTDVRTCTPDDALHEAARIMWERDCGCVPVVASDGSGRVVGMVTDRDLCMASYTSGAPLAEIPVRSAMAGRIRSCHPEDALSEAEEVMRTAQVRRLPVVDEEGRLRGLLSLADLAEGAAGVRAPAGTVSAAEVALVLEAICRPRTGIARS